MTADPRSLVRFLRDALIVERFARGLRKFGGPTQAAIGGVGALAVALVLLFQTSYAVAGGFLLLAIWCFFAFVVMRRY